MESCKASVEKIDRDSGEKLADRVQSKMQKPEVLITYFTIEHPSQDQLSSFARQLKSALPDDTLITGVSIAGFLTDQSDYISTEGAVAIGLKDAETSIQSLEGDLWKADKEEVREVTDTALAESRTNFLFKSGPRQSEQNSRIWDIAQDQALRLVQIASIRKNLIDRVNKSFIDGKIGFTTHANTVIEELVRKDHKILINNSMDGGEFRKGHELLDGELKSSEGFLAIGFGNDEIDLINTLPPIEENYEHLEVIEKFKDVRNYKNIIYELDGKSVSEIKKNLPIGSTRLEKGGFSYYALAFTDERTFAVSIPDIDLLITSRDLKEDSINEVWVLRFPNLAEYNEILENRLSKYESTPLTQVNLHSSVLSFYENSAANIADVIDENADEWVAIIGDIWTEEKQENFMYPSIVRYR